MKRQISNSVISAVGVVIMLIGGCGGQEQDISKPDAVQKERLMGAEKRQLEKETEKLRKEKEELTQHLQKERAAAEQFRKDRDGRLATAGEEKSKLDKANKELGKQIRQLERELEKIKESKKSELRAATEENIKLSQANEGLKVKVGQLEEELGTLKSAEKFKKWQQETQKSISDLSNQSLEYFEEIAQLRVENENLKTEIAKLEKELEANKAPASSPHTD